MPNHFYNMLQHLRHYEEVMLFGNILQVSKEDEKEALLYLEAEYNKEVLDYPFSAPSFQPDAALWAAKTVYIASQLMLYRENKEAELDQLLPPYQSAITASAILSADIMLRFLPHIAKHAKVIDPDDKLISVVQGHLQVWHYSGLSVPLPSEGLDFKPVVSDKCLYQLYVNRVIEHRQLGLARHPALEVGVKASLGLHASSFWKEYHLKIIAEK